MSIANGPNHFFIDGQWVEPHGEQTHAVRDPATNEQFATLSQASEGEVDQAVAAARRSLESASWSGMTPATRAKLLWSVADLIEEHGDELARLETKDQGQPLALATQMSVAGAAEHFRYFAGWTTKLDGRVPAISKTDTLMYTTREPVGVCGLIIPWNFPLLIAAWKLAPALAAGNTVVIKPAEQTSQTTLRLFELMAEAGFPPGVINLVTGDGAVGHAIASHPGVDKVSFTGSTLVGRNIIRSAGDNLTRITLELGGKAASVVCPDADLERSVPMNAANATNNSGQVCGAISRFYVHESRYEEFISRMETELAKITVGPGWKDGVQMGPLNSAEHLQRVEAMVDEARETGAEVLQGGSRLGGELSAGNFYPPTLLTGVQENQRIARDEIFGPVLPVMTYTDEDEVIARVNDSKYGLGASVFTENLGRAHRLAKSISAGAVRINTVAGLDPAAPWGGLRASGWGREMGEEALEAYTEVKSIWIGTGQ